MTRKTSDRLALAALLVVVALPFLDILLGLRAWFIRDMVRYYYPTKRIIREAVLSGELPLWNPYYSAGQPMAANPEYEVFYPPQWLIFLPNYDLGYRLHILVHFWIAAAGAFLLLRGFGLTRRASFIGGFSFALGGFFLSTVNLLPIMFCAAWIPAVLHVAHRFLVHPDRRSFAIASLVLGVQMLVGEPTTLVQTWGLLGLFAAWRVLRKGFRPLATVRAQLLVLAIGLGGGLIGAVQLIPAADHAGDSIRSRGFSFELVRAWSMNPWRPSEFLFPNVLGHVWIDGTMYWGSGLYKGTGSPFYFSLYPGLILAALAISYIVLRRRGALTGGALTIASLVVAAGLHTPLLRILYDAGIFASIRYPEKFSLPAILVIWLFGSIALDRVIRGDKALLRVCGVIVSITVLIAAVVSVVTFLPQWEPWFRKIFGLRSTRAGEMMATARIDWYLALLRGFVTLAILDVIRRGRFRGWAFAAGVLVLASDLAWSGRSSVPRTSGDFYTRPPVATQLPPETRSYRLFHEADWYGSSKIARSYFSAGGDVYWIVRNGLYPMTPATWGIRTVLERDYDRTALLSTTDLVDAMWKVRDGGQKDWRRIFMSMGNAWYRTEYVTYDDAVAAAGSPRAAISVNLIPAAERWPRDWFANEIESVSSAEQFTSRLIDGAWSPGKAFVPAGVEPVAGSGRVLTSREGFNWRALHVRVDTPSAFLVSSVTPHRYWSATIDGRPAPIITTNLAYSGIEIPAGDHVVRMRYRNPLVMIFGWVAIVSLVILIACASIPRRREREAAVA